jgi:hypothetical protein
MARTKRQKKDLISVTVQHASTHPPPEKVPVELIKRNPVSVSAAGVINGPKQQQ